MKNSQRVTIKARFPFGILDIENIELLPLEVAEPTLKPNKSIPPNVIRTTAISEVAAIGELLAPRLIREIGKMAKFIIFPA